jgi:hypothetical protein
VTLDSDTDQLVRRRMRERNLSFKEAVNDLIRQGSGSGTTEFRTRTAPMGTSRVNLDRALQVSGQLEDDELLRRVRTGS